MLAFFSNLHPFELGLAFFVALLVFGGRLPEVVMDIARRVYRLRAMLTDLRRESGLDDELRNLQRTVRDAEYEVRRSVERPSGPRKMQPGAGKQGGRKSTGPKGPKKGPRQLDPAGEIQEPVYETAPEPDPETLEPTLRDAEQLDAELDPEAGADDYRGRPEAEGGASEGREDGGRDEGERAAGS